jgi:DNA helicase HerA-like ATPase
VFDAPSKAARPLNYKELLRPGSVSIIDLSDSGMSELSNIVIADLLRGIQQEQDDIYEKYEKAREKGTEASPPARVLTIIEEAHEFLSAERIDKMPILFEQVARVAKRGRKRGLGLVFVTQLPQHLPRQVFGLVNSYLLHKITDPQVVSNLKRTVSGIDDSLWRQVPGPAHDPPAARRGRSFARKASLDRLTVFLVSGLLFRAGAPPSVSGSFTCVCR